MTVENAAASCPADLYGAACLRWASGTGDEVDAAAAALAPLPASAAPESYGLPIPPGCHAEYARRKNAARAHAHQVRDLQNAHALDAALLRLPDEPASLRERNAVAAFVAAAPSSLTSPVLCGLAEAARRGIGRAACASWTVRRGAFLSLSAPATAAALVAALRADGWAPAIDGDDPEVLVFEAGPTVSDAVLVGVVRSVMADPGYAAARRAGILLAGSARDARVLRSAGARASRVMRGLWAVELALRGMSSSLLASRCIPGVESAYRSDLKTRKRNRPRPDPCWRRKREDK
jgi:hypothetical protein